MGFEDLAGIGITLGERMENLGGKQVFIHSFDLGDVLRGCL